MKRVLMYGGGLDSTAILLLSQLEENAKFDLAVHCDYGQLAAISEIIACERWCDALNIPLLQIACSYRASGVLTGGAGGTELTGRNLYLLMETLLVLTKQFGHDADIQIVFGFTYGMFPENGKAYLADTSPEFVFACNQLLAVAGIKATVVAPYQHAQRLEVVRRAYRLNPNILTHSFSCYTPLQGKPCGSCRHCVELEKYKSQMEV